MPSCKHGSHSQAAVLPATRRVTWFGGTSWRPSLIFPVCLHFWLSYGIFYERTPSFFGSKGRAGARPNYVSQRLPGEGGRARSMAGREAGGGSVAARAAQKLFSLSGLFAVYKPKGPTSAAVLNLLKERLLAGRSPAC